jgi:zinc protease
VTTSTATTSTVTTAGSAPTTTGPAVPGVGPVPAVGPLQPPPLPPYAERTVGAGLRVLAVQRAGGVAEIRLRVPFASADADHPARAHLLAETLLTGTARHDRAGLAAALQGLGADLSAGVDADRLVVSGNGLAAALPDLLGLLAEVLSGATHPDGEVALERDRAVSELAVARSQPSVVAREALLQRLHGDHPYGRELPTAEEVAAVEPGAVRALHAERVRPDGALIVLVADLDPQAALDLVERALGPWAAEGSGSAAEAPPAPTRAGGLLLVDRPGAVQSTLRLAGPAVGRADPAYAPLVLANLVFGGYFSSRLVANIRERRGYTYSPHSGIEHARAGSRLVVGADVSTGVTAPALLETRYELGRIATLPVEAAELAAGRRYATGILALATATAADLASTLVGLLTAGVGPEWLHDHPRALEAATEADVLAAAAAYLAPARLTTVVVGDAGLVRGGLETLDVVETE